MQQVIDATPIAVFIYCALALFAGYHLGYERGKDDHFRQQRKKRKEEEKKLPRVPAKFRTKVAKQLE